MGSSAILLGDLSVSFFYRPQSSCGKVMFLHLSVILSGEGWGSGRHPPEQTLPWTDPLGTLPPPRRPLQRTVRIQLECILVLGVNIALLRRNELGGRVRRGDGLHSGIRREGQEYQRLRHQRYLLRHRVPIQGIRRDAAGEAAARPQVRSPSLFGGGGGWIRVRLVES